MKKALTQEDVLLYLYGESSPLEQMALENAVAKDWDLREKINQLNEVRSKLDELSYEPSPTSIKIILDHSRSGEAIA